jgi:large subunit ribosomal protein L24
LKFASHLSEELRERYRRRSVRPTVGDSVKIVRGEFKDIEGKVTKVLPKEGRITVEGVNKEKTAGGNAPVPIHSSNVIVTSLKLDDKLRKRKLEVSA